MEPREDWLRRIARRNAELAPYIIGPAEVVGVGHEPFLVDPLTGERVGRDDDPCPEGD